MKLNLFLIIIIFGSLSARAQLAGEQDFSLEAAVRQALGHNAELAAARLSVDEARARLLQAGRWSNPELESSFAPNARGREGSFTVGVNQRFPVTSRLRLEKKLSGGQVAVAVAEVAEFERSLTLQVRTAGIRLAALDAQLLLNERRQRNSLDLEAAARAAADAGEGQELEAAQIEMETGHLEIQRVRLKKERAEAATELRLLMGLPEDAVILIGSMEIPSPGTGVTLRPDLRAAQARPWGSTLDVH